MLRANVGADGPFDGTGRRHPEGSYIRLFVDPHGPADGRHFLISMGAAECLVVEIQGIFRNEEHQGR